MPRLVIQSIPRTVFFQSDAWTKSWLYHLSLQETRGESLRVVEARFDVMGPQGLLRRDVYDEERLACHLKHGSIGVEEGRNVKEGQKLGECGNTGVTTVCPHIHLGLSVNGQGVPPMLADVRTFNPLELEDRVYTPMSVLKSAVLRHGQIVENV